MSEEREIVFWDLPDQEELRFTDKDEAIDSIVDDLAEGTAEFELCGYSSMEHKFDPEEMLEDILSNADEEFGCPDEATEPTAAMIEAAKSFANVLNAEYVVWACEEVYRETINVSEWKREQQAKE